jgi:2-methylcitrate dehydratase PrpD
MTGKKKEKGAVSPLMSELASYIGTALRDPLPAPVVEKTKHHLLDTIAAMVSGARLPPGKMAIAYVRKLHEVKEAAVAGSRVRVSAVHAAFANAMLAHADETDDAHAPAMMHPGCAIVPAALAMAERGQPRTASSLLRAVALGYDIACTS